MPRGAHSLLVAAALNALAAIAAGAFGAHGLEGRLDAHHLDIWQTAARYHMYGALGMAVCALAAASAPGALRAGWVQQAGAAIFAVSLYLLAVTGTKWLGAITPLGGLGMMAGWALLALAAWRARGATRTE
jgi:uncharacterized membrane protein YgdD (TMEM256/DUF423 family)